MNLSKKSSLYNSGMLPLFFSTAEYNKLMETSNKENSSAQNLWKRQAYYVCYYEVENDKKVSYSMSFVFKGINNFFINKF